eukprot:PhF_6_TR4965/c0_g1_i1/m.7036
MWKFSVSPQNLTTTRITAKKVNTVVTQYIKNTKLIRTIRQPTGTGFVFQFSDNNIGDATRLYEAFNSYFLQPRDWHAFDFQWGQIGADQEFVPREIGYESWVGVAACIGSFAVWTAVGAYLGRMYVIRKSSIVSFTQMSKVEEDMLNFPFIRAKPAGEYKSPPHESYKFH